MAHRQGGIIRTVAYDLETTDLKGLMGRLLCASFCIITSADPAEIGTVTTFRCDTKPWRSRDPIDDSKLAIAVRDYLDGFHCIVGWNSKLFDAPFLNARLVQAGHQELRPQMHLDLMWYAGGSSMRVGSKKLDNVQKFLRLGEEKTDIDWDDWKRAALGNKDAMNNVVAHCEQDVLVLRDAYWRMIGLVRNIHK